MKIFLFLILNILAVIAEQPNFILMNMDDVSVIRSFIIDKYIEIHKTLQKNLFFFFTGGSITSWTAFSNTSFRPSFVKDEHSI